MIVPACPAYQGRCFLCAPKQSAFGRQGVPALWFSDGCGAGEMCRNGKGAAALNYYAAALTYSGGHPEITFKHWFSVKIGFFRRHIINLTGCLLCDFSVQYDYVRQLAGMTILQILFSIVSPCDIS